MHTITADTTQDSANTHFMWLEITGSCQLECDHCYAESGPGKSHGSMSEAQWTTALSQAASAGVSRVQFIGGEPTTHPALPRLISHALGLDLQVEVFSNLFSIRDHVWRTLAQPGVALATSYYSAGAEEHERITHRRGSYARTKAGIAEAIRREIPLRVGLIRLSDDQDIAAATEELVGIGVARDQINIDDLRGVGRGTGATACEAEEQLCGNCANGVLAIMPDGTVQPCVFSREARFEVGNIADGGLQSVMEGVRLREVRQSLTSAFVERGIIGADCPPADPGHADCAPAGGGGPCAPAGAAQACSPACSPSCAPAGNCNPIVNPAPCNPIGGHPPRPEPAPRPPGPVCSPLPS